MNKKYFHILLFAFLVTPYLYGQHISGAMQFSNPINEKDSNLISFSYSNLFYFRDYEYFNNIQTGYTIFGTWQYPRITYQPNKWLRLDAGILLQKEFGDKGLDKAWPMFSLQLQKNDFRFLFGALESNQTHQLIEPLMQYDQVLERPLETGMQLKINKKRFQSDLWLDWEVRQKLNADYPEELTAGLSVSTTLTDPKKPFQIKIPLQFLLPHKGGQLDTNSSIVSTIINYATGLQTEWNNPDAGHWTKQLKVEGYYAGYYHSDQSSPYPYNNGNGWLANLFVRSKWDVYLLLTYWRGHHFIAGRGGKLFQSISSITTTPNYTESDRKLLFLTLGYEKELFPGFFIDLRFTPYYDLYKNHSEQSYLILLSYRKIFKLLTLRK